MIINIYKKIQTSNLTDIIKFANILILKSPTLTFKARWGFIFIQNLWVGKKGIKMKQKLDWKS